MENKARPEENLPEPGMKWHNFLKFWLPFTGILSIASLPIELVLPLTSAYTEHYTAAMTFCDIANALFSAACGVLALVTWRGMVNFREGAPRLYMAQYAIRFFCGLLLTMVTNVVGGDMLYEGYMALNLVIAALFLWANDVYFRKRAHLYVN